MTAVALKAEIHLSASHAIKNVLMKQYQYSLTNKETASLFAKILLKPLTALGWDARKKRDMEVLEWMLKGWLDSKPLWRPNNSLLVPVKGGAAAGDYLEQEVMEHVFRNTAIFTPPANIYVALFTTATNDTNTGGTEVSGGSYARVAVGTTTGWDAPGATGGATANSAPVTFPTATGNWGTIGWMALQDALTLGNRFVHAALTASKTVNSGDEALFPTGDIDVTLA